MSSHHFVKEDQEPAVYIHDIEQFNLNVHEGLLEWSPTVICTSNNVEALLELYIKVDVVINSGSSSLKTLQSQCQFAEIEFNSNPAFSVFQFLKSKKQVSLNIIGAEDDLQLRREIRSNPFTQTNIYSKDKKSWFTKSHAKWYNKNDVIWLDPLDNKEVYINSEKHILPSVKKYAMQKEGFWSLNSIHLCLLSELL